MINWKNVKRRIIDLKIPNTVYQDLLWYRILETLGMNSNFNPSICIFQGVLEDRVRCPQIWIKEIHT